MGIRRKFYCFLRFLICKTGIFKSITQAKILVYLRRKILT